MIAYFDAPGTGRDLRRLRSARRPGRGRRRRSGGLPAAEGRLHQRPLAAGNRADELLGAAHRLEGLEAAHQERLHLPKAGDPGRALPCP